MDRYTFNELFDTTVSRLRELNNTKGVEYSGYEDVLSDFREVAAALGVTPKQALLTYMTKHWRAINSYVKEERVLSEAIEGRIDDLILYGILLQAMVADEQLDAIADELAGKACACDGCASHSKCDYDGLPPEAEDGEFLDHHTQQVS